MAPLFVVYETFDGPAVTQANVDAFLGQLDTLVEAAAGSGRSDHRAAAAEVRVVTPAAGAQHLGWGSKIQHVAASITIEPPTRPTFVIDSRDVLLNGGADIDGIMRRYLQLVGGGDGDHRVVVSAEPQCCVSALSHAEPYTFFAGNGSRVGRACQSGAAGCTGTGPAGNERWAGAMRQMAPNTTIGF